MEIRFVTIADAAELAEIYAHYVTDTAITFECEPPSAAEFAGRIEKTRRRYPYIAAASDGKILGYAYASALKGRAAYDWSVETTVYVRPSAQRRGVGKALYERLEELLRRQNVTNAYACITYPNEPSIAFHKSMGYEERGRFFGCGYKMGKWWDVVWLEKILSPHENPPAAFIPAEKIF